MAKMLPPVHPGEILKHEFLAPLGLSAGALARRIGVPRTRIERVVKEETPITTDTALRLAKVFGTSPEFWANLQSLYDLKIAEKAMASELAHIETLEGTAV
ncbi:addiction module antitoxin [Methyloceanibacter methanicus]|uniref:Addiction module antitoxin n=1 Tax=Methyloceanibacter methanicus TaxID=1774968 RepID=A0A1E3VXZ8_9HYPH|nr:HigA family addiction module antitoxin [Methyloceanibacter methanicus]ODR98414.1 addiction module antitoxin [Methyloceanibacter methanicus]